MKQERLSGDREESPGFSRGEDVNSTICTHCSRASHLDCRQPWCDCPCREQREAS